MPVPWVLVGFWARLVSWMDSCRGCKQASRGGGLSAVFGHGGGFQLCPSSSTHGAGRRFLDPRMWPMSRDYCLPVSLRDEMSVVSLKLDLDETNSALAFRMEDRLSQPPRSPAPLVNISPGVGVVKVYFPVVIPNLVLDSVRSLVPPIATVPFPF